jgi:HptB-dependent secretion and biofilm anti anti-sigma factor
MRTTVERVNGKLTIKLQGRFDVSSHRAFRDSYASGLGAQDVHEFEIDLNNVEYLDSSALGMLLMLREKAQASNQSVTLANCSGTVKQILDVANFARLFSMR